MISAPHGPPLWPFMTFLVDTERRAEVTVRFLAAHDVDVIRVYNSVPEASLEVIVRSAHELDLPVTGHVPRAITMTREIDLDVDGLENIRVTGREMLDGAAVISAVPPQSPRRRTRARPTIATALQTASRGVMHRGKLGVACVGPLSSGTRS